MPLHQRGSYSFLQQGSPTSFGGWQFVRWHSRAAKPSPPIKHDDNGDHSHPDHLPPTSIVAGSTPSMLKKYLYGCQCTALSMLSRAKKNDGALLISSKHSGSRGDGDSNLLTCVLQDHPEVRHHRLPTKSPAPSAPPQTFRTVLRDSIRSGRHRQ